MDQNELIEKFTGYLSEKIDGASDLSLDNPVRIFGGASRETWLVDLAYEVAETRVEKKIILRITQESALIETDASTEFDAYSAFYRTSVPVPEALFLENDVAHVGYPFVVMAAVSGKAGSIMELDPYLEHRAKVGQQIWPILGAIAAADPDDIGLSAKFTAPELEDCWRRELDHWESIIDEDEPEPQPILRGAIRWLRANPPPAPARIHVVHGDFRTGNYLVEDDGEVTAVLDWEMCHLGDPMEDLGWALSPLWCFGDANLSGGTIPRREAIALWEQASGLIVDPLALDWWEKFACVKGLAIWLSAAHEFTTGSNTDSVNLFSAWRCVEVHNRILSKIFVEGAA